MLDDKYDHQDFAVYQGESLLAQWRARDNDGADVDVSSWSFTLKIYSSAQDNPGSELISHSTGGATVTVTDYNGGTNNLVQSLLVASETTDLGAYENYYELRGVDSGGRERVSAAGRLIVRPSPGRP